MPLSQQGLGTHEEQEVYTIHQTKNTSKRIKGFGLKSYDIISSTDHPFAIPDTLRKCLQKTKKSLLISAPYVSKSFIDLIRTLFKGVMIKFLTRIPDEKKYWVPRAIESLATIASSLGLELNIRCKPNLHAKFIVIDNEIVLSGSVNPTSSGMYDNDELLYVFKNPEAVKHHIEIFGKLWNCPRNTTWENVQSYSGYKNSNNRYFLRERIAEAVEGFFYLNHNQPTNRGVLVQKMERKGYKREEVIEVIKNLLYDSPAVLWEPRRDMLQLLDYQTDIDDFQ